MKKEPHKKRIAMFLIIGFIILTGIILKSIADKIIPDNNNLAVMYFSESIKGLAVGSPVVYEGVNIGKVVKIEIITNPETLEFSIPVFVRLFQDDDISKMSLNQELSRIEILHRLINKGLRARLTNQNFLTGQLMIELLMLPDTPIVFKETIKGKHLFEIPTTLSTFAGLSRDLQDLPIKEIVSRLNNILIEIEKELPDILPEYASFGQKLNKYLDDNTPQTSQTLNQINQTLKEISAASKSVKDLSDYLERHPDSLLKGKKL